jgi:hypothetical protein
MAAQLTKSQVVAWLTTTSDHNEAGQRPTWADRKVVESQVSDGNRQRERTLQAGGLNGGSVKSRLTLKRRSSSVAYVKLFGPAMGQTRRLGRGKPGQPGAPRKLRSSMLARAAHTKDGHDRSSKLVMDADHQC